MDFFQGNILLKNQGNSRANSEGDSQFITENQGISRANAEQGGHFKSKKIMTLFEDNNGQFGCLDGTIMTKIIQNPGT